MVLSGMSEGLVGLRRAKRERRTKPKRKPKQYETSSFGFSSLPLLDEIIFNFHSGG
jgi:hypothetical protein